MIDDAEAIRYIAHLAQLEQQPGHKEATITMGPFTAFVMIGALQLATRHPNFSPGHHQLVGQIIDQCKPMFRGTPAEQLLDLGDDPANDVPRHSCEHQASNFMPCTECGR